MGFLGWIGNLRCGLAFVVVIGDDGGSDGTGPPRPTVDIELSVQERDTLARWARRPKSAQALALRCRIVLAAADGKRNKDIAAELGCNLATVTKWRNRFAQRRLDGLQDEPRPGPPRSITDEDVERVIVKTLEETPSDATHWSTR